MNKKLAIVLIVAAFLVGVIGGLIGGASSASYFYGRMIKSLGSSQEAIQVSTDVAILNRLRSNNTTNAIELLETDLDNSLIGLGIWFDNSSVSNRTDIQLKAINRAKEYRDKFPHKSGEADLDRSVSNTLSLASNPTGK